MLCVYSEKFNLEYNTKPVFFLSVVYEQALKESFTKTKDEVAALKQERYSDTQILFRFSDQRWN